MKKCNVFTFTVTPWWAQNSILVGLTHYFSSCHSPVGLTATFTGSRPLLSPLPLPCGSHCYFHWVSPTTFPLPLRRGSHRHFHWVSPTTFHLLEECIHSRLFHNKTRRSKTALFYCSIILFQIFITSYTVMPRPSRGSSLSSIVPKYLLPIVRTHDTNERCMTFISCSICHISKRLAHFYFLFSFFNLNIHPCYLLH